MPWGKKKSALTVKNATIMTRSCSSFFKMFSSTRIHPQQESRGGPSVNPSRHHSLRHHWFPNQKCFISVYIFFLFVCSWCTGSLLPCRLLSSRSRGLLITLLSAGVYCRRSRAPGPSGFSVCSLQALDTGSDSQAQWLCTSGIFPDQGVNQCPLHCKADS